MKTPVFNCISANLIFGIRVNYLLKQYGELKVYKFPEFYHCEGIFSTPSPNFVDEGVEKKGVKKNKIICLYFFFCFQNILNPLIGRDMSFYLVDI